MSRPVRSALHRIASLATRRPVAFSAGTTGLIFSAGDLLAQVGEQVCAGAGSSSTASGSSGGSWSSGSSGSCSSPSTRSTTSVAGDSQSSPKEPGSSSSSSWSGNASTIRLDFMRCANVCGYGTVLLGPGLGLWYTRILPWLVATSSTAREKIVKMVIWDQMIVSVLVDSSFLYILKFLQVVQRKDEDRHLEVTYERAHAEAAAHTWGNFLWVYQIDLAFWPWVQALNFAFVPHHLQTPVVSLVGVGWDAFLSYVQNNAEGA